jgi:hypothetical protein
MRIWLVFERFLYTYRCREMNNFDINILWPNRALWPNTGHIMISRPLAIHVWHTTKLIVDRSGNEPRPMSIWAWHVAESKDVRFSSSLDPQLLGLTRG